MSSLEVNFYLESIELQTIVNIDVQFKTIQDNSAKKTHTHV